MATIYTSSLSTMKSKANAGQDGKRKNPSGNTTRVKAANVAVARRFAGRKTLTSRRDTDKAGTAGSSLGLSKDSTQMPSMFGDNINVSGGRFIIAETVNQNSKSSEVEDAFKLLQKHVATSAFHNSAQRVDPPRCHPDTREEILENMYNWIVQSEDREKWLLWLNGAAGAGKSAIIQSLVETCALSAMAIASFFFFRGDHTRNTMAPLVPTLVYQLIRAIPETKNDILIAIECDPLIFGQSLECQLQQLIIQPLLRLPTELQRLFVVFIDGLDECNDRLHQSNLIKVLGDVTRRRNTPVVFLVASRREYQIDAAFVLDPVAHLLTTVPLDNSDIEKTSDDIRLFLSDKFKEIKETHLHKRLLSSSWPPISAIDEIVAKSSGQFIFASVVVNYISSPRNNPSRQLELVRDIRLREVSSQNPFVHLDALYYHIFSQVEDLDKVLNILALQMLLQWSLSELEGAFQLEPNEVAVCLADLTAVITCDYHGRWGAGEMKFLHASLPDFLRDESRSGIYHIDLNEYKIKLLCIFLERQPPMLNSLSLTLGVASMQETHRLHAIERLISETRPKMSDRLHGAFMKFNFMLYSQKMTYAYRVNEYCTSILKYLRHWNLYDQGQAYRCVFDRFASEYDKFSVTFEDWTSEEPPVGI